MIWFGTKQKMQWVPEPQTGVQRRQVASVQAGTLDRGGGYVSRSNASHVEYSWDFAVQEAGTADGLDVFAEYASGLHDDWSAYVGSAGASGFNPNDLIYWSDPMDWQSNLLPPHWASPALIGKGWPSWGPGGPPTWYTTLPNGNRLPPKAPIFPLQDVPPNQLSSDPRATVVIPIPPGHTLRWHWRGHAYQTAMRAVAHHKSGGTDLVQDVAPVAMTSATRVGNAISGDTYDYVTFGLIRTSSIQSAVATVAGMVAQIHRGAAPEATGPHIAGRGVTGCQFLDSAIPETYYLASEGKRLKGLSFSLKEVGAWL